MSHYFFMSMLQSASYGLKELKYLRKNRCLYGVSPLSASPSKRERKVYTDLKKLVGVVYKIYGDGDYFLVCISGINRDTNQSV